METSKRERAVMVASKDKGNPICRALCGMHLPMWHAHFLRHLRYQELCCPGRGCHQCIRAISSAQYVEWFLWRFGIKLDRDLMFPVLHALEGHPDSGSLCAELIVTILEAMGFKKTYHEP
jgi:hypothetical protein